jgi:hypothetical protein
MGEREQGFLTRGACFDVELVFGCPNGAKQNSPGQRAGDIRGGPAISVFPSPERATHDVILGGDATELEIVPPIQGGLEKLGLASCLPSPGRCPGLICGAPAGHRKKAQHQKARAGPAQQASRVKVIARSLVRRVGPCRQGGVSGHCGRKFEVGGASRRPDRGAARARSLGVYLRSEKP